MFLFEYAQFKNGQFVTFIDGGVFPTLDAARAHAISRGFICEGDDHLISEVKPEGAK